MTRATAPPEKTRRHRRTNLISRDGGLAYSLVLADKCGGDITFSCDEGQILSAATGGVHISQSWQASVVVTVHALRLCDGHVHPLRHGGGTGTGTKQAVKIRTRLSSKFLPMQCFSKNGVQTAQTGVFPRTGVQSARSTGGGRDLSRDRNQASSENSHEAELQILTHAMFFEEWGPDPSRDRNQASSENSHKAELQILTHAMFFKEWGPDRPDRRPPPDGRPICTFHGRRTRSVPRPRKTYCHHHTCLPRPRNIQNLGSRGDGDDVRLKKTSFS